MITSSDFDGKHAEKRTIVSVSNASINPILVLDEPLEFAHSAEITEIEDFEIEARTSVAVLHRNIKI